MSLQDLNEKFPIVDPNTGRATMYLLRLLRDRKSFAGDLDALVTSLQDTVTTLQDSVDAIDGTVFNAGAGLAGGGTLGTDDPISFSLNAGIDQLTDVDTSTTAPTDGQALVWVDADSLWKPGDVASGGGGGGGGGVWEFVGEEVASGGEGTLEVTSIPTDVEALRVLCTGNKTTAGKVLIRFNNNSGSNYDFARHFGGAVHNDGLFTNQTSFNDIYAVTDVSNNFAYMDALVLGSGNSSTWTTILSKAGMWVASNYVLDAAGEYQVAEAVTSIQMIADAGTWNAGSKIQIWALKKTASGGGGGGGSRSGAGWTKADEPPASPNSNDDEFDDSTLDAAWTTINSGAGLTFTETDNGLEGSIGADGTRLRGLAKAVPASSSDFTITLAIHDLWTPGTTFSGCTLYVTSGTTTAAEGYSISLYDDSNPNFTVARHYWSNLNTRSDASLMWDGRLQAPPIYLRMRVYDDAGTWRADFSISRSGFFYQELSTGVSLGFTPTHMGLGMYDRGSSGANALFGWFRVTEA